MARVAAARREEHEELRRTQILDAALAVFSRDGFHATRVEAIAREAGLAKGTIYLYFPTKEAIVQAAVERFSLLPVLSDLTAELLAELRDAARGALVHALPRREVGRAAPAVAELEPAVRRDRGADDARGAQTAIHAPVSESAFRHRGSAPRRKSSETVATIASSAIGWSAAAPSTSWLSRKVRRPPRSVRPATSVSIGRSAPRSMQRSR